MDGMRTRSSWCGRLRGRVHGAGCCRGLARSRCWVCSAVKRLLGKVRRRAGSAGKAKHSAGHHQSQQEGGRKKCAKAWAEAEARQTLLSGTGRRWWCRSVSRVSGRAHSTR